MKETPEQTPFKVGEEVVTNRFESNERVKFTPELEPLVGKKGAITYLGQSELTRGLAQVHTYLWPLSGLTRASEAETVEEETADKLERKIKTEISYYALDKKMSIDVCAHNIHMLVSAHISALQKEVETLKEAQRWAEEKHQEALANYNSYAASEMQSNYEDAIEKAIVDLQFKAHMVQSMMSAEEAAPIKSAFEIAVSVLRDINADEF